MKNQKGFTHIIIVIFIAAIAGAVVAAAWYYKENTIQTTQTSNTNITNDKAELRYIQYRTFKCEGVFDFDDPKDCFISKYEVSPWKDINIHGGYSSSNPQRKYTSLGIAITKCSKCVDAQFIEFTAASRSAGCSIDVKVDPNDFGVFNETIFPSSDPYQGYDLQARENLKIPIWQYTSQGINEFMIFPNPAGCDMEVQDLQIY